MISNGIMNQEICDNNLQFGAWRPRGSRGHVRNRKHTGKSFLYQGTAKQNKTDVDTSFFLNPLSGAEHKGKTKVE